MDFHNYITTREACKRSGAAEDPDDFYRSAFDGAIQMDSAQFYGQLQVERAWEQGNKPYYAVWPSIVPMLTRLSLDLDSALIQLPLPALCIRLPKDKSPLTFDWKGEDVQIRCMMLGEINEGRGLSILIDVGEMMGDGEGFGVPIYTYRNFRRQRGLTVEKALQELGSNELAEMGVQIPLDLITDCVRLCCSLCLLENDPSVIEPDVLSKDKAKFEGQRRPEVRGQGTSTWQGRLECGAAHRSFAALPATTHGPGVDWSRADGAQDRATQRQRCASGVGGKGAEWIWGEGGVMNVGDWVFFSDLEAMPPDHPDYKAVSESQSVEACGIGFLGFTEDGKVADEYIPGEAQEGEDWQFILEIIPNAEQCFDALREREDD